MEIVLLFMDEPIWYELNEKKTDGMKTIGMEWRSKQANKWWNRKIKRKNDQAAYKWAIEIATKKKI